MNREELPSILCVDDEPRVVDSLAVHLRRDYQVLAANGGNSALQILKEKGAPAVIVSDMRMPGMDGATLLKHVRQLYPETTRILLTGEPGRDAAISAVNEGQIFRFLTKPCPPDQLRSAIDAGVVHHRLLIAEKVLLQQTLIGCIKALVDILAITTRGDVRSDVLKELERLEAHSQIGGRPSFDVAWIWSELGLVD